MARKCGRVREMMDLSQGLLWAFQAGLRDGEHTSPAFIPETNAFM
jgi:hypothetical protein